MPTKAHNHTDDVSTKTRTPEQRHAQPKATWAELFQKRLGTFIVSALVALLTVFSNTLTERIKFGLDRADMRQSKFAQLSEDLSIYLFDCELEQEYLTEGASQVSLYDSVGKELNNSITTLRKAEYSNRAIIAHYWAAERAQEFDTIMSDVKSLDLVLHELNISGDKFTPDLEKRVSAEIKSRLDSLKRKVQAFLLEMQ